MGKIYLQYLDGPSHSFNHFKNNNNNNNNNNSTLTKTDDDDQDMNNNYSNNNNHNNNVIHKVFTCSNCDTHLSRNEDIISKNFHGRHGKAYLFNRAVNVSVGPNEQRTLMTGLHVVCDIYCNQCETIVGWKYERAQEPSQRYKIGKFILEKAKLRKDRNWGRASPFSLVDHPRHPRHLQSMHQKTSHSHFISAFVDQSEASVAVDNKRMGSLTGVGVNHVRFATDEDDDLMMTMNSNEHMNSNSSSSSSVGGGGSSSGSSNIHFGSINNSNSGSSIMLTVVPNDVTSETNSNNDTGRGNNSNNSRRRQRIRARNPQALTYLINSRTTRSDDTDEDDEEEEASIEAFYVDDHEENFEEEEEEEVEAEEEEEEIDEGVEQRIRSEATGAIERVLNLLSQSTRGGMTSSGGGASRRGRPRDDDDDEEL